MIKNLFSRSVIFQTKILKNFFFKFKISKFDLFSGEGKEHEKYFKICLELRYAEFI